MNNTEVLDYIRIPLGRDNLFALLDKEDADLAAFPWYAHQGKQGQFYAAYRESTGARERYWLHDLVIERVVLRELADGELADHINRDKLDCRRGNLRVANKSQNAANITKAQKYSTSQYKGVSKFRKKWKASITVNGTTIYLGIFDKESDAGYAYNEAATTHFGKFAVLNKIKE